MTAAQLIELMGPLHVNHPKYKARARSLLPIPNIAGVQAVYELMAQHHMKVEYAYDISSDAAWVRATAPNGIHVSVKETPAGLAVDTQLCVERLAEALK